MNIIIKKEMAALFVLRARTSKRGRNLEEKLTVVNKFIGVIEHSQINLLEKNKILTCPSKEKTLKMYKKSLTLAKR